MKTPARVLAPRFLTRFQCIADRCEDSCCVGLKVLLTPADKARLQASMSNDAQGRMEFAKTVRELSFSPSAELCSELGTQTDGSCSFLSPHRLCSVITRHGEPALPEICALYPRRFAEVGDQIEVTATLGCPEAARLCLLHEDAMDLVDAPPTVSSRLPTSLGRAAEGAETPFMQSVRSAGARLLRLENFPLGARLLFLIQFTGHLDSTRGMDAENEKLISKLQKGGCDTARGQSWLDQLPPASPPENALRLSLLWLLGAETRGNPRFYRLWSAICSSYYEEVARARHSASIAASVSHAELYHSMNARRARLATFAGHEVERAFRNFALSEWYLVRHARSQPLSRRVLELMLKIATLRYMFYGHPEVCSVLAKVDGNSSLTPDHTAALDRGLVESTQVFSKYVDSDPDVLGNVLNLLELEPLLFGESDLRRAATFAPLC